MNSLKLMLFLTHCVEKAEQFNLDYNDIELIDNLKRSDLELLSSSKVGFLKLEFDKDKFKRALDICRETIEEEKMIIEYIKLGASAPMMRSLFGHNAMEVRTLREKLGLQEKGGRPSSPSVDEQLKITHVWSESYKMDEREHFLHVARVTRIPLRTIWNEISSFDLNTPVSESSNRKIGDVGLENAKLKLQR